MGQLDGKVALVTGAAGGIGSEIARLFATEGAAVALLDLKQLELEKLAAGIRERGGRVCVCATDITQSDKVRQAVATTLDLFGNLTVVVNAVGVLYQGKVDEMEEADFDALMAVNVKGVFLTCKYAVPALKASGGGSIVNLSSVSAFSGSDNSCAYHASKGAVLSLTYSLAQELAPSHIRVNALCPGWVDAGFTHQAMTEASNPERLRTAAKQFHLLGRMATPQEVSQAALFLASPAASFITGTPLFVDGGFMVKR